MNSPNPIVIVAKEIISCLVMAVSPGNVEEEAHYTLALGPVRTQ